MRLAPNTRTASRFSVVNFLFFYGMSDIRSFCLFFHRFTAVQCIPQPSPSFVVTIVCLRDNHRHYRGLLISVQHPHRHQHQGFYYYYYYFLSILEIIILRWPAFIVVVQFVQFNSIILNSSPLNTAKDNKEFTYSPTDRKNI